jgi:hypothetical protein
MSEKRRNIFAGYGMDYARLGAVVLSIAFLLWVAVWLIPHIVVSLELGDLMNEKTTYSWNQLFGIVPAVLLASYSFNLFQVSIYQLIWRGGLRPLTGSGYGIINCIVIWHSIALATWLIGWLLAAMILGPFFIGKDISQSAPVFLIMIFIQGLFGNVIGALTGIMAELDLK